MKIWQSYGSEHSINLVMIGRFKELSDAEEAKALIDALFDDLNNKVQIETRQDRYSSEVLDLLMSRNISYLSPQELGQFLFDIDVRLEGNEIRVTTEEEDVSGIQKLMLHKGAKIEVFSAHDYPESKSKV